MKFSRAGITDAFQKEEKGNPWMLAFLSWVLLFYFFIFYFYFFFFRLRQCENKRERNHDGFENGPNGREGGSYGGRYFLCVEAVRGNAFFFLKLSSSLANLVNFDQQ